MREEAEVENFLKVAEEQVKTSRARDYWEGIQDTLEWVLGHDIAAFRVWLMVAEQKAAGTPGPPPYTRRPVDLGDDPDGDIEGYDGA
jgi:hypothetical protein